MANWLFSNLSAAGKLNIGNWNLFVIWNLHIEILLLIYKDKKSKI